jgi:DNA invertase Pin-like site-specific DNA recombinase
LGQVAIYCRVSTDDQSCERQERDLRAFARRAGHTVAGVFKDREPGTIASNATRSWRSLAITRLTQSWSPS